MNVLVYIYGTASVEHEALLKEFPTSFGDFAYTRNGTPNIFGEVS